MTNEGFENTSDNFGKFIYQLQLKNKALAWKLESNLIKLYWQHESLMFNQTCLNKGLLPKHTHTHTHTHTYIYITYDK